MKKLSMVLVALVMTITLSANTFTKVSSAPEDWSGQYLLTLNTDSMVYVFNGQSGKGIYATAPLPVENVIKSDDLDGYVVEIAPMQGGYSALFVASGKYLSGTSGENVMNLTLEPVLNAIQFNKDGTVDLISNTSVLVFNATSITNTYLFRYYKPATASKTGYQHLTLFKAENSVVPDSWEPDTISVSEVKRLIKDSVKGDDGKLLMKKTHYVKGIVSNPNFGNQWPGYAIVWMRDIENELDTIEAYKIYKDANTTKWSSREEIPFGYCDTVLMFADELMHYEDKTTNVDEIASGYFSKMMGKTSMVNFTSTYKYAFGAIAADAEVAPFPYEVVLSKEAESKENALHFMIKTKEEKGIVGTYTIGDESYADNGQENTPISGSLKISFKEEDGPYNKYDVVALFSMDGGTYRIDSTYAILGWYSDLTETFPLVDDKPFIPTDDQEITCAQAQEYALQVLEEGAESGIHVSVIGYANNAYEPSGTQQSFYMDDVVGGKKVVQSYYGNLPAGKKVINGAKVRLSGYLQHYVKNNEHTAEIKNGTIEILEGGEEMKREVVLEQIPDGALTVAEAKALTDKLSMKDAQHSDTSDVVVVKGYVTKLYNSFQNGNQSFYMDDVPATGDAYYDFEAFKCSLADYVVIGDEVFVEGRLVKYVGTSKSGSTYTNYNIVNCTGHFVALSTALREIAAKMPAAQVKKVLYRGNLYIMRAGAIFDLNGNKMN